MDKKFTFTVENVAGGNKKSFQLKGGGMSISALKHAVNCRDCGGPKFGGPAADEAMAEYEKIEEQYMDGEASDVVEEIFQG